METSLEIYRGDDLRYDITIKNGSTPVDITGDTIFFTIKQYVDSDDSADENALVKDTVTEHTDAQGGISEVHIPGSETTGIKTGMYMFDVQWKRGSSGDITTLVSGTILVKPDITRRTT